jgi:ribonuclease J
MNLTIHRGSKKIGGNCVEIKSQSKRLLVDLGLRLNAENDPKQFLPKIPGLDGVVHPYSASDMAHIWLMLSIQDI